MNAPNASFIVRDFEEKLSHLFSVPQLAELRTVYENMSGRYRQSYSEKSLKTEKEALAYCLARLPATLTVLEKVLTEYKELAAPSIQSVADLGCGPALSAVMLQTIFPSLRHITSVEQNPSMWAVAHKLIQGLAGVTLERADLRNYTPPLADLMIFSYSLGELDEKQQDLILSKAWDQATHALIVIEPGTPQGFQTQARLRALLIEKSGYILAPCGHNGVCPLKGTPNDWCHFPIHVPRSRAHQFLKNASLSYEVEKYIYVIATKKPIKIDQQRLIRPPLKRHGHTVLDVCTEQGIARQTFTKSKNENYAALHHLEWGDLYPTLYPA